MKSTVKHYKYINGKLTFVGNEIHEYSRKECPCQPSEETVLEERRANGRHTVILATSPKGRGRPVDPLKRQLADAISQSEIERMISERQYEGSTNPDDESVTDLLPESNNIIEEDAE